MALTLTTNPVGSGTSKFFAGFQKCEVVFKREDLAVATVVAGVGDKAKITHAGDLSGVVLPGDVIYLYSPATNMTYDGLFKVLTVAAGEITVDTPYIESGGVGYLNYKKNYYVELQCVNPTIPELNILPFSLESDGDSAGNIIIDVSICNELNSQRGVIVESHVSESTTEFEIQYREVYSGSSNAFTLVDGKLFIMLYAIDAPSESTVLNQFDIPKLYLSYPGAICAAIKAGAPGSESELAYNELNNNREVITDSTLGIIETDVNGYFIWQWPSAASVADSTVYIDFSLYINAVYDFATPDFATPDFLIS